MGVVGCGMVASEYAATLAAEDRVRLVACADLDSDRAQDLADRYAIPVMPVDRLLAPEVVDLALILTPPHTHADFGERAITAGLLAVWVEKPLAIDPHRAAELISRAQRANVLLGSAPDTLLGPALQSAKKALDQDLIGEIRSASATLLSTGPERWHPSPEPFYAEHAGPLGDMGPYYLTALDFLLGPLHVRAATAHTRPARTIRSGPRAGSNFTADAPTYVAALLETNTGAPVTLTTSFDAAGTHAPHLEIHGSTGTLVLPDPNFHDGPVLHRSYGAREWTAIDTDRAIGPLGRGLGVLDLAAAVREGREPQCSPQRGERTVRLMDVILRTANVVIPDQTISPATSPVSR
ncbi:Gfo/Idh/MocA family oxidoreductase [Streptomyces sp. NPDC004732]|uniref:Gfo/Idh/MocA family protein n=1 Tax=Streptomyces sp. NPDC004732 TaxID=3154290 RepID=UPI0033B2126E